MKSIIVLLTIIFTILILGTTLVRADGSKCLPIFNGGQTCSQPENIELDKLIKNPKTNSYVDNLDPKDTVSPSQQLTFHLVLKNKKDSKIGGIKVTDTLPQSLEFVSASDNGKYNPDLRTVTYTIDLEGNKSHELTLNTKTGTDEGCTANQAQAEAQGKKALDNTQFCIAKNTPKPASPEAPKSNITYVVATPTPIQSMPTPSAPTLGSTTKGGKTLFPVPGQITTNPSTGPEALALIALLPAGLSGLIIRKKSKTS